MLKIEEPRVSREPIVKMLTIKASLGRDDEDSSVSSTTEMSGPHKRIITVILRPSTPSRHSE